MPTTTDLQQNTTESNAATWNSVESTKELESKPLYGTGFAIGRFVNAVIHFDINSWVFRGLLLLSIGAAYGLQQVGLAPSYNGWAGELVVLGLITLVMLFVLIVAITETRPARERRKQRNS